MRVFCSIRISQCVSVFHLSAVKPDAVHGLKTTAKSPEELVIAWNSPRFYEGLECDITYVDEWDGTEQVALICAVDSHVICVPSSEFRKTLANSQEKGAPLLSMTAMHRLWSERTNRN